MPICVETSDCKQASTWAFGGLTHAQRLLGRPCLVLLQQPRRPAVPLLLARPQLYSSKSHCTPALGLSFWGASGLAPWHQPPCSQRILQQFALFMLPSVHLLLLGLTMMMMWMKGRV